VGLFYWLPFYILYSTYMFWYVIYVSVQGNWPLSSLLVELNIVSFIHFVKLRTVRFGSVRLNIFWLGLSPILVACVPYIPRADNPCREIIVLFRRLFPAEPPLEKP
jgi:hypothetical protein